MEELVKEVNTAEILGVLEQIQKVNYMIDMHRRHGEDSMVRQFERQREGFLEELRMLFEALGIKAELSVSAA